MLLSEIVAEIDEKYANGLSNDSKCRKADILQKRIFRQLRKQNYVTYDLTTDQPEYPLTVNEDDIFQVDVGLTTTDEYCTYPLRKVTDITNTCSNYYYTLSTPETGGWIGFYPTPTDDVDSAVIYYYERPATLSASNLSATPMLDEKYHMMLVYGVCKEIAENYRDTDNSTGFAIQYNALEAELLGLRKESDVYTVRNEMGW